MGDQSKETVANDPDVIRAVRELAATEGETGGTPDDMALVRRAMEMLDGVTHLLKALSPSEIQSASTRTFLGRLDDAPAIFWKVYVTRHRVLSDVFANLHSEFVQRARQHLARRPPSEPEPTP